MKFMTPYDKIVVVAIIVISIILSFVFISGENNDRQLFVKIESCGEEFAVYPLDNFEKTIEINTKFGYNEIKISNGNVWVSKSDCNDKIEVNEGKICKIGQKLICLPNRLVISIVSGNAKVDGVTY